MLVCGENIGLKRTSTSQDSRTPPAKHHRIGGRHSPSRRSENTSQEWPWFRKILSLFTDTFRAGQTFGPAETHSEHLRRGVDQPHSALNAKQQKLEQQRLKRRPPVKRVKKM